MQFEPKHPDQLDLHLSEAEQAESLARETSDLAKLSSEVIEKGLVREQRPVFVYDKTLAKAKQGNALRQEKFRVEREKQGLKTGLAPIEILEKVKELGGGADGWAKFMALSGNVKDDFGHGGVPVQVEIKEVIVEKIVEVEVIKEVFTEKIVEKIVEKEVQGPTVYKEKTVIQHDLKLRPEQRDALKVGEKVASLTGWKLKIVRFLAGI